MGSSLVVVAATKRYKTMSRRMSFLTRASRWIAEEASHQSSKWIKGFQWDISRPTTPKAIFDFERSPELRSSPSLSEWTLGSDEEIGGASTCTLTATDKSIVFSGNLEIPKDINVGTETSDPSKKRAYCAIRTKVPRRLQELYEYRGLELKVRSKYERQVFSVNLTAKSFFPDDLYQGFLMNLPPSEWVSATLPFDRFVLTSYGYEKEVQRELNKEAVKTIGFTVMSDRPGPFELEISRIRAAPYYEDEDEDAMQMVLLDDGESDANEESGATMRRARRSEAQDLQRQERIRMSIERRKRRQRESEKGGG